MNITEPINKKDFIEVIVKGFLASIFITTITGLGIADPKYWVAVIALNIIVIW